MVSLGITLAMLAGIPSAAAELAVFTDGRVLKVADARLDGWEIVLELIDGGTLRVPAVRVDRVVADEVETRADDAVQSDQDCPWSWADERLPEEIPYRDLITHLARQSGVHPWLLVAVVEAESAFDSSAVSRVGAAGLMQLMPAAAADQNVRDPFDPEENLRGGTRHLRGLLDRFGSLHLALAAYNAGAATVDRYEGVPPYRETRQYVRRVVEAFCRGT